VKKVCVLHCENCVHEQIEKFNKQFPKFPNGNAYPVLNGKANNNYCSAVSAFNLLSNQVNACERRIDEWRNNGADSDIKKESRNYIASVIIYSLKKKPIQPISERDNQNIQTLRNNQVSLSSVARSLNIESRTLKKLLK